MFWGFLFHQNKEKNDEFQLRSNASFLEWFLTGLKNSFGKVSFSLIRFFWTRKRNEYMF